MKNYRVGVAPKPTCRVIQPAWRPIISSTNTLMEGAAIEQEPGQKSVNGMAVF